MPKRNAPMASLALDHITVVDTTPAELAAVAAQTGCDGVCIFLHAMPDALPRLPEYNLIADAAARRAVVAVVPDCVPAPFGHVGDGNIHFNVLSPPGMPGDTFSRQWPALARAIEDTALSFGGTVSAEHGIGQSKREALMRMKTPVELEIMTGIKKVFDPDGLLNPGKILF